MIVKNKAIQIQDQRMFIQVLKMNQQLLINIQDDDFIAFDSLIFAITTPYDQLPTVIDIINQENDMVHTLARSISKKLNLQVFLNYNHRIELTLEILQQVRMTLFELIDSMIKQA